MDCYRILTSQGSSSDSFPVGTILAYNGELKDIPKKWALCDGNNGTPNLTGRFLQGWGSDDFNTYSIGDFISPGLPNITGYISGESETYHTSGAFRCAGGGFANYSEDNNGNNNFITFDASRCSAIYGASKTVQPRSYVVYYIIKIRK